MSQAVDVCEVTELQFLPELIAFRLFPSDPLNLCLTTAWQLITFLAVSYVFNVKLLIYFFPNLKKNKPKKHTV